MEIRNARLSDAKEISKMYAELIAFELSLYSGADRKIAKVLEKGDAKTPKQITKHLHSRNMRIIVAHENGNLAGFLTGQIDKLADSTKQTAGKFDIFVRKTYRRHGVGHVLINEFTKWLKDKKCHYISLYAFNANYAAGEFYKKQGFKHMSDFYIKKL